MHCFGSNHWSEIWKLYFCRRNRCFWDVCATGWVEYVVIWKYVGATDQLDILILNEEAILENKLKGGSGKKMSLFNIVVLFWCCYCLFVFFNHNISGMVHKIILGHLVPSWINQDNPPPPSPLLGRINTGVNGGRDTFMYFVSSLHLTPSP